MTFSTIIMLGEMQLTSLSNALCFFSRSKHPLASKEAKVRPGHLQGSIRRSARVMAQDKASKGMTCFHCPMYLESK